MSREADGGGTGGQEGEPSGCAELLVRLDRLLFCTCSSGSKQTVTQPLACAACQLAAGRTDSLSLSARPESRCELAPLRADMPLAFPSASARNRSARRETILSHRAMVQARQDVTEACRHPVSTATVTTVGVHVRSIGEGECTAARRLRNYLRRVRSRPALCLMRIHHGRLLVRVPRQLEE